MDERDLHGAWSLVSATGVRSDGRLIEPYGPNPKGSLMYGVEGRMSAIIVDGAIAETELRAGGRKRSSRRTVAYFGSYEVRPGDGTVTHHVEGSLFPDWVGEELPRKIELEGDRMTLRPPPLQRPSGDVQLVLVWKRLAG